MTGIGEKVVKLLPCRDTAKILMPSNSISVPCCMGFEAALVYCTSMNFTLRVELLYKCFGRFFCQFSKHKRTSDSTEVLLKLHTVNRKFGVVHIFTLTLRF